MTQNAIKVGKKLTEHAARELITMRALYIDLAHEALARKDYDLAIKFSFEAQLCREALESSKFSHLLHHER